MSNVTIVSILVIKILQIAKVKKRDNDPHGLYHNYDSYDYHQELGLIERLLHKIHSNPQDLGHDHKGHDHDREQSSYKLNQD